MIIINALFIYFKKYNIVKIINPILDNTYLLIYVS